MLEKRCKLSWRRRSKYERLFRRLLHSRHRCISSTLNLGARVHSYARLFEMSVIFADTGRSARAVFHRKKPPARSPPARPHISEHTQMTDARTKSKWRAAMSTGCHPLIHIYNVHAPLMSQCMSVCMQGFLGWLAGQLVGRLVGQPAGPGRPAGRLPALRPTARGPAGWPAGRLAGRLASWVSALGLVAN